MSQFEIFPWNDNFETGIPLIDEQHKELVRLINALVRHIAKGSEPPVLDEIIQELNDYVLYHFSAEESIWGAHFEGDVWFKWHHQSHNDFVNEITKIRTAEHSKPFEETLLDIVKFLTHWLARHILDSDRRMAKVVLALPSGISLAMAKESADAEMTGAAKVLVDTLMTMYDRLADSTVEMSREIQRRQKAEVELTQAKSILEKGSRAKSVYLANLSHELRTPLNTILGYSELLYRDASVNGLVKEELAVIRKSGDHLLAVINEVLEMAKIEAGHVQLELTPADLSVTIVEVIDMFQLRAVEKSIGFHFDRSAVQGRYILTDEAKVKQILINLISNAIKATSCGDITVRLSYAATSPDHLSIEVQDSGVGIAEADLERIFVPFEQIEVPGSRQGTGLGLSICKEFSGLLGGQLSVASQLGKGATFLISLPITEPLAQDIVYVTKDEGAVIGLADGQDSVRILVVDNEDDNRNLLARLLESVGFVVEVAKDGKEAVERFATSSPHFIWMDRRMPVMDGITAATHIRALPGGRQVKIAAVTASISQKGDGDSSVFDAIVYKPFRAQQIFECMGRLLDIRYEREVPKNLRIPEAEISEDSFRKLPVELLTKLSAAFHTLSQDSIFSAIESVRAQDDQLAAELKRKAQRYEYESILNMLNSICPTDDPMTGSAVSKDQQDR
jgi:hemerythrin-like metal-binding protein